jgi:hypothetical protein
VLPVTWRWICPNPSLAVLFDSQRVSESLTKSTACTPAVKEFLLRALSSGDVTLPELSLHDDRRALRLFSSIVPTDMRTPIHRRVLDALRFQELATF